jgi:hypothetical protein
VPSKADLREAVMATALLSRQEEFEQTLRAKRAQGYRIESQDDTQAVLLGKSRRRFFNLLGGADVRYLLSFNEHGRTTTRRIEEGS